MDRPGVRQVVRGAELGTGPRLAGRAGPAHAAARVRRVAIPDLRLPAVSGGLRHRRSTGYVKVPSAYQDYNGQALGRDSYLGLRPVVAESVSAQQLEYLGLGAGRGRRDHRRRRGPRGRAAPGPADRDVIRSGHCGGSGLIGACCAQPELAQAALEQASAGRHAVRVGRQQTRPLSASPLRQVGRVLAVERWRGRRIGMCRWSRSRHGSCRSSCTSATPHRRLRRCDLLRTIRRLHHAGDASEPRQVPGVPAARR